MKPSVCLTYLKRSKCTDEIVWRLEIVRNSFNDKKASKFLSSFGRLRKEDLKKM